MRTHTRAQSAVAFPLSNNDELFGVVYLEHNQVANAFTKKMATVLSAMGTQFAICYESIGMTAQLDASVQVLRELSLVSAWFLSPRFVSPTDTA